MATHFLSIARIHMTARNQPHTLTAHWEFLARSAVGRCVFVVEDVKLGRQTSVLHIRLYQSPDGYPSAALPDHMPWVASSLVKKPIATAYVTQTNFATERGITLDTGYELHPPVPPVNLSRLLPEKGEPEDEHWMPMPIPDTAFKKIRNLSNCMYFVPRRGQPRKGTVDMWLRLPNNEKFTPDRLGYVIDAWPTVVESYRPSPPAPGDETVSDEDKHLTPFPWDQVFWYPTVVMNLEVKKALAEEGEEWLFMRSAARQIRNGRLDLQVLVYDRHGDLVALSSHVNLVLGAERNVAGRAKSLL